MHGIDFNFENCWCLDLPRVIFILERIPDLDSGSMANLVKFVLSNSVNHMSVSYVKLRITSRAADVGNGFAAPV